MIVYRFYNFWSRHHFYVGFSWSWHCLVGLRRDLTETKNQWARDDPAFVVVCSFLLAVAASAFCAALVFLCLFCSFRSAIFFCLMLILLAVDLTHYVFIVLCQSLMWCVWYVVCVICGVFFCRYGDNVAKAVLIVVSVVCVHFLLVGISLATICWWASFCILSWFPSFMVVLCILNSQTANLGNCKNQERLKNFN
jgi:hypothetical protein